MELRISGQMGPPIPAFVGGDPVQKSADSAPAANVINILSDGTAVWEDSDRCSPGTS
jgi:hypothetical protein